MGCSEGDDTPHDTGDGGSAGTSQGEAMPDCVRQIVEAKCQRCHGDPLTNGAPAPFFTATDFQAQYFDTEFKWWEISAERVDADTMPMVALNDSPNPPNPPIEPLTPGEKATLLDWLERGAPAAGSGVCP